VRPTKQILLASAVAAAIAVALPGQSRAAGEKEDITLNFVNADIQSVIKTVGLITGKNFLIDPRVNGTVNIVSANPVSKDLVYPILLSALRLQGFAAIEERGFVKIVPEADAKVNFSVTSDKPLATGGDRIVTQCIRCNTRTPRNCCRCCVL